MVKRREGSILEVEKEREHARSEKDKVWAELAKAQDALWEHEQALAATVRERNSLKVHVVSIRVLWPRPMRKLSKNTRRTSRQMSPKASLMKVNSGFDVEYYDKLILEPDEPQTLAPEDLVGFDQLDPIRTPRTAVGPSALGE